MEPNNRLQSMFPEPIAHDFQYNEALETKRKELLGNLASSEYGGYKELFHGNQEKLFEKLQSYGIQVKKMGKLLDLMTKITGINMVGVAIGSRIGVPKEGEVEESTYVHEGIHAKQYQENGPKALLGYIMFGLIKQGLLQAKLKLKRRKYGARVAFRSSINNTPAEREAYGNEGNTNYLDERKPFAYRKYATKQGRSQIVQELINKDIDERINKLDALEQMMKTKEAITEDEVAMIDVLIDELLQDIAKIQKIQKEHGKGDRELISYIASPKGPMVWLESEKNRDKRLEILNQLLYKEHVFIQELKRHKNVKIISSKKDIDEKGIIRIQAIDGETQELLRNLESDSIIRDLRPDMVYDKTKNQIRISFTL